MQVFDIYTFNLNTVVFKDNKEYLDGLFIELGLNYTDVGFCFRSYYVGASGIKAIDRLPSLNKYKKYDEHAPSETEPLTEKRLSSISVLGTDIGLYVEREDICDLGLLLKAVPRPVNFSFMGVLLDNINWDDGLVSKPYFKPNAAKIAEIDNRFSCYYSNSIRFVKEFDYGNKLNLVEVIIEREADLEKVAPHPKKFTALCAKLGKLIAKRTECVFDAVEAERLRRANEVLKKTDRNKFDGLFAEFMIDFPKTPQGMAEKEIESLEQIKGFSPKKLFTSIGKKHGYRYKRCINGHYELEKVNAHNHVFKVTFAIKPFSSLLFAFITARGYNFELSIAAFPDAIIHCEEEFELYAGKAFDAVGEIENEYTEKLFSYYGKTPEWYEA